MKHALTIVLATGLLAAVTLGQWTAPAPRPAAVQDGIAVFFSPNGGCTDAVVQQIESAKKSIRVQAFILSTNRISKPLIDAHKRGVEVVVILDKHWSEKEISLGGPLAQAGIPVYLDDPPDGSAHSKVMVIDSRTIITGSFNFSRSADENNVENLLVVTNRPRLAEAYEAHMRQRQAVSARQP